MRISLRYVTEQNGMTWKRLYKKKEERIDWIENSFKIINKNRCTSLSFFFFGCIHNQVMVLWFDSPRFAVHECLDRFVDFTHTFLWNNLDVANKGQYKINDDKCNTTTTTIITTGITPKATTATTTITFIIVMIIIMGAAMV